LENVTFWVFEENTGYPNHKFLKQECKQFPIFIIFPWEILYFCLLFPDFSN